MTSFLKGFLWGKHMKHKRLLEDWSAGEKEPEAEYELAILSNGAVVEGIDGPLFAVKYMGSTVVENPDEKNATSKAIKSVVTSSKASGKKPQRVIVHVTLKGIKVIDLSSKEDQFDVSIFSIPSYCCRISYCYADLSFNNTFAFMATNMDQKTECYVFLSRKRKLAQHATLAIARTFNAAYEFWQLPNNNPLVVEPNKEDPQSMAVKINGTKKAEEVEGAVALVPSTEKEDRVKIDEDRPLIDFYTDVNQQKKRKQWVIFHDEDEINGVNPVLQARRNPTTINVKDTPSNRVGEVNMTLNSP